VTPTERTCGDCPWFFPTGVEALSDDPFVVRGTCDIDGEDVRADNPQCSSAPSGNPATPCGEIGGDDGTTSAD